MTFAKWTEHGTIYIHLTREDVELITEALSAVHWADSENKHRGKSGDALSGKFRTVLTLAADIFDREVS